MAGSNQPDTVTVFIPPLLRKLVVGAVFVRTNAGTLQQILDELEIRFPGLRAKLCDENGIRPGLTVSVGDTILSHGLAESIPPGSEVHFLPSLGGG